MDVCLDNQPFGVAGGGNVGYGQQLGLFSVAAAGITHTISVFPTLGTGQQGLECSTAPGPYLGNSTIAVATLATPANANIRWTVVLGGTKASGTLGLYVYAEPTWPIPPAGSAVISHNAAPAFSLGPPLRGVGFGFCTTTVTPCTVATNLTGAQNLAKPNPTGVGPTTTVNGNVQSGLNAIPAGFYDGIGVPAGTVVPITSVAAPNALSGQPYVIALYAIDGPAGGLNLIALVEQTLGFGF